MIAGFALEGRDGRTVIGIDASTTLEQTVAQVTRIAHDTAERIGLGRALRPDEITVVSCAADTTGLSVPLVVFRGCEFAMPAPTKRRPPDRWYGEAHLRLSSRLPVALIGCPSSRSRP